MPRLDRIHIPIYLTSNQASNSSHYFVKGDGIKSNHHLVSCVLKIAQRTSIGK
jgi:N-acetyl-anhydromuramyl-L-alanine amidase AmpD